MKKRIFARVGLMAALAVVCALCSCGGGGKDDAAASGFATPIQATPKFVYTLNNLSDNISAYTLETATGNLLPLAGLPYSTLAGASYLAAHPNGNFLYVTSLGKISVFTVNRITAELQPAAVGPFNAVRAPNGIVIAPSGRFAYVINPDFNSNSVSAYVIDAATGSLTLVGDSPFALTGTPSSIAIDPGSKFVYVSHQNADDDGTQVGGVSAFKVDATTGALTPVANSPFAAGYVPSSVKVHPSGKFLYVSNQNASVVDNGNNVSAYAIDSASGSLTPLANAPFASGQSSVAVASDPAGKFLFVANNTGSDVSVYTVDAGTGNLTEVSGSPFAAGANPKSVAVDLAGKFLYVGNGGSTSTVTGFSINPATGELTALSNSPFPSGTRPLAIVMVEGSL